jgi:hypothetical protein
MKQAFTDEMAETPSEVGPIEREIGTISDLTNKLRLSLEKHEARIDAILRPDDVIAGERNSDGVDALRAATVELRVMFDAMGSIEFEQLGHVFEQVMTLPAWNV